MIPSRLSRRQLLQAATALAAAPLAQAQTAKGAASTRSVCVAQIVDLSTGQQDVSKDFLIGSRAAWQEFNARGGLRGRPVQHLALETDGSPASLREALRAAQDSGCVALSGTAGGAAASALTELLPAEAVDLAHVAPWLQNASAQIDARTFPIFAPRRDQIAHALHSLSSQGVPELGAVFASPLEQSLYRDDVERTAAALKLRVQSYTATMGLRALARQMGPTGSSILVYIGGTPELVEFTQGLDRQARQRYLVAMADVNLQTLQQLGTKRLFPVIATQAVPLISSGMPLVRRYRATLARLFDEPPSPLSLAGYVAARYTIEVLQQVEGPLTRASVLGAFQQRRPLDLDGYRISFDSQGRSSRYVTQSMLTPDGRIIG